MMNTTEIIAAAERGLVESMQNNQIEEVKYRLREILAAKKALQMLEDQYNNRLKEFEQERKLLSEELDRI